MKNVVAIAALLISGSAFANREPLVDTRNFDCQTLRTWVKANGRRYFITENKGRYYYYENYVPTCPEIGPAFMGWAKDASGQMCAIGYVCDKPY